MTTKRPDKSLSMDRRYFLKVTGAGAVTATALGGSSLFADNTTQIVL